MNLLFVLMIGMAMLAVLLLVYIACKDWGSENNDHEGIRQFGLMR